MGQERLYVSAVAVPCRQAPDNERVADVVQPWLVSSTVPSDHPGAVPQLGKSVPEGPAPEGRPVAINEECRRLVLGRAVDLPSVGIML